MEAEVVVISYDRKSKERISEEFIKKKVVEDSFQEQFIRLIAEGMKDSDIFKIMKNNKLFNNVA